MEEHEATEPGLAGRGSHPTPAFPFNVMAFPFNVMAFPTNVMAFPIHGMAPSLAAAPGHGQVALGAKKVALGPAPQVRVRPRSRSAPLSSSQAPLGHGLAPPPPGPGQISNWKRPVNGNAIWGGVGWGGMVYEKTSFIPYEKASKSECLTLWLNSSCEHVSF